MSDMNSLRYTFLTLVLAGLTLALSSWRDGERCQCLTMLILPSGSLSIEVARLTSSISSPPKQMTT